MNIDDFKIIIKKYDMEKSVVIVNVIVQDILEIRGFQVRYATFKKPPYASQWIVSPPSQRMKRSSKYFWFVQINDITLWYSLQEKIIVSVKEYTNK